jgi:hypothetical protein
MAEELSMFLDKPAHRGVHVARLRWGGLEEPPGCHDVVGRAGDRVKLHLHPADLRLQGRERPLPLGFGPDWGCAPRVEIGEFLVMVLMVLGIRSRLRHRRPGRIFFGTHQVL